MNDHYDELLTVDELAGELKVPRTWVYSKTREKGPHAIPKVRVGKYVRFRRRDVFKWLEHQS